MSYESIVWVVALCFIGGSTLSLTNMVQRQQFRLRCINKKLDALLKAQGVEWSFLSPEVEALALDPGRKIAAIKLHREKNPGLGIAEAKAEVEAFASKTH